jgi:hypothetical protein
MSATQDLVKTPLEDVLKDLSAAEQEICNILRISQDTCKELENIPVSDGERLKELSALYFESVKSTRSLLMRHVSKIGVEVSESTTVRDRAIEEQRIRIANTINYLDDKESKL